MKVTVNIEATTPQDQKEIVALACLLKNIAKNLETIERSRDDMRVSIKAMTAQAMLVKNTVKAQDYCRSMLIMEGGECLVGVQSVAHGYELCLESPRRVDGQAVIKSRSVLLNLKA